MQELNFLYQSEMRNRSAIRLLLAANFISGLAQGLSMIAIASYLGIVIKEQNFLQDVYFIIALVTIFWGIYAGSLVDRFSRKNIMLIVGGLGGVFLLSTALYGMANDGLPKEAVGMVFAFTMFVYNIHYPNLYAFAQEITEPKDYGRITSLLEIVGQFTTASAGAVAAFLLKGTEGGMANILGFNIEVPFDIAPVSIEKIFLVDGITYLLAISIIMFIKYEPIDRLQKDFGSVVGRLKIGIGYLKERPLLFGFGLASYGVFISILLISFSLLPIYLPNQLNAGSDIYATAEMYYAIGSAFAGVFILRIFRNTTLTRSIITLTALAMTILIVLLFNKSLGVFYGLFLLFGLSNAGIRILRITYIFKIVPNNLMGRVGSVISNSGMVVRFLFASLFTLNFFTVSNNIIYAFLILAVFVSICLSFLVAKRKSLEEMVRN